MRRYGELSLPRKPSGASQRPESLTGATVVRQPQRAARCWTRLPEVGRAGLSRLLSPRATSARHTWLPGSTHPRLSLHEIAGKPGRRTSKTMPRACAQLRDRVTVPAFTGPLSARERPVTAQRPPGS